MAEETDRHRYFWTQCLGKFMNDFPANLAQRPLRIASKLTFTSLPVYRTQSPYREGLPLTVHLPRQVASPQGVCTWYCLSQLGKFSSYSYFFKKKGKKDCDYLISWEHLQKITLRSPRLLKLLFLFSFFQLLMLCSGFWGWINSYRVGFEINFNFEH